MYLQAVASNMTSELDTPATLEDAGAGWMESGNTAHAHGADRLLLQYYNSQKIVDMVTDYLSADILTFGYDKLELYHS